ncbi:MAG TPA: hypothetical protein VD731_02530 [Nitrosopumilaceae archaeon]|nr:hypothetical protein [Nitrosopumilaceae archaeon]
MKFDFKNKFKLDNKDNSKEIENKDDKNDEEKTEIKSLKTEMIASLIKENSSDEEDKTVTFADMSAIEEELEPKNSVKIQVDNEKQSSSSVKQTVEQKQQNDLDTSLEEKLVAKVEEKLKATIEEKLGSSSNLSRQSKEFSQRLDAKKPTKKISPDTEKISKLIKAIEGSSKKMIIPSVDLTEGKISYPILAQIGEDVDNLDFLEKLASQNFDILERTVYERLVVCPDHPETMSTSVQLHCPRCSSLNISKLQLIEHKRCGYISENKNFEISEDGQILTCPSCKKSIHDAKKEIARPAMWYSCNECREKFDDVSIKMYCRSFNHDFEISNAHSITIPGFSLKNLQDTSNSSISPILKPLKNILDSFGFTAEENYTITGKSGNHYRINIYGEDENKRTVFIYVKNPNAESDNSELNSKIIEVLDTSPNVAILIGFPSISEKAKTITSNYNISIITEQNPDKILSSIKNILSEKVSKLER